MSDLDRARELAYRDVIPWSSFFKLWTFTECELTSNYCRKIFDDSSDKDWGKLYSYWYDLMRGDSFKRHSLRMEWSGKLVAHFGEFILSLGTLTEHEVPSLELVLNYPGIPEYLRMLSNNLNLSGSYSSIELSYEYSALGVTLKSCNGGIQATFEVDSTLTWQPCMRPAITVKTTEFPGINNSPGTNYNGEYIFNAEGEIDTSEAFSGLYFPGNVSSHEAMEAVKGFRGEMVSLGFRPESEILRRMSDSMCDLFLIPHVDYCHVW